MWQDDRFTGQPIKVAIIGAGGIGRQVLDILNDCNTVYYKYDIQGFIVENEFFQEGIMVNEVPIISNFDFIKENSDSINFIFAVGDIDLKLRWYKELSKYNLTFFNAIHPNAYISKYNTIGNGNIIDNGCIVSNTKSIGNHNLFNLQVTIGHDCIIDDFVTIGPGSHISGNVNIGRATYIGTGTNIIEKLNIGRYATIGAGACVVSNLEDGVTAVGVPAKIIKVRKDVN